MNDIDDLEDQLPDDYEDNGEWLVKQGGPMSMRNCYEDDNESYSPAL